MGLMHANGDTTSGDTMTDQLANTACQNGTPGKNKVSAARNDAMMMAEIAVVKVTHAASKSAN